MFDNKYSMFNLLISGFDKATQQTLAIMYAREKIREQREKEQEHQKLVKEVADDVLSRISATVDVSDIIEKIEELDEAIKKLGK